MKNYALDFPHLGTYDSSLLQNILRQQFILDKSIKNISEHLVCLKSENTNLHLFLKQRHCILILVCNSVFSIYCILTQ